MKKLWNPRGAARQVALDATVLSVTIDQALRELDAALAGYPTSASGAPPNSAQAVGLDAGPCVAVTCGLWPCPGHEGDGSSTSVESAALVTDRARVVLEELHENLRLAAHHVRRAAAISQAWGTARLDKSTVASMLVAIDAGLWCENCARHGQRNTRDEGHKLCQFCRKFRAQYGRLPSKRIFKVRDARGGKIYEQDVKRIHAAQDEEAAARKEAERAKRAEDKAAS